MVQLRAEHIGTGHPFKVSRRTHRRLATAVRNRRGIRLALTPSELRESQGAGFFDNLKKGFQKIGQVGKKIVNSDFYKQYVKPLAKQAVSDALKIAPIPEEFRPLAEGAAEKLGSETGAYGLKKRRRVHRQSHRLSGRAHRSPHYDLGENLYGQVDVASTDKPNFGLVQAVGGAVHRRVSQHDRVQDRQNLGRYGRLQKGSKEAYEWAEHMRQAKARKRGGSFLAAGY